MSRPIRFQQGYEVSPGRLYATLADREYLDAKLAAIGGNNAAILDHAADADTAKYTLRQGVSRQYLPGAVQKILRGDLIIERAETWRRGAGDNYEGTISARVKDAPGNISGNLRISGSEASGQFQVDGEVRVDVPLIGGKIEEAIAEQVVRLLRREGQFTEEWLAR
jgi:hypothetical protein